jgi:catechol 2,3-dioxygenase-like lactoylglutathione lyase family enzyme
VLGLKLVSDAEATPEMSTRFGTSTHGYRVVRLQTPYGERIKLVQTRKPPSENPIPEWVYERQGTYLTFIVADMQEVVARLTEHGVRLVREAPIQVRPGFIALFVLDPEGNYVEFVEYADPAAYRPDLFKWRQFF